MNPIRILTVTPISNYRLVILWDDETLRLWSFPFQGRSQRSHPLRDSSLFQQAEVSPDGLQVLWPNGECRTASELYSASRSLPLTMGDLIELCRQNILSTSEAAELLNCTRQNVDNLAVRGKLHPIKSYKRNRFFLRGDVVRRCRWNGAAFPSPDASGKVSPVSLPCPKQRQETI